MTKQTYQLTHPCCPICDDLLDYDEHYCSNKECEGYRSIFAMLVAKGKGSATTKTVTVQLKRNTDVNIVFFK